jgi:hypothetical protein
MSPVLSVTIIAIIGKVIISTVVMSQRVLHSSSENNTIDWKCLQRQALFSQKCQLH